MWRFSTSLDVGDRNGVDTGIDAIYLLGPSDGLDLAEAKESHGDRLTPRGGAGKLMGTLDRASIREHIADRAKNCRPGR